MAMAPHCNSAGGKCVLRSPHDTSLQLQVDETRKSECLNIKTKNANKPPGRRRLLQMVDPAIHRSHIGRPSFHRQSLQGIFPSRQDVVPRVQRASLWKSTRTGAGFDTSAA